MVKVWLLGDSDERTECHRNPPEFLGIDKLIELGVQYDHIPKENADGGIKQVCSERGYTFRDELVIGSDRMHGFEEKARNWFSEHIHLDEEVRYIAGGSGYFDVRDKEDHWVRIHASEGDLLVLPAGIYHRYSIDSNDYTSVLRFFLNEPKWGAFYRGPETDKMEARQEYVMKYINKSF